MRPRKPEAPRPPAPKRKPPKPKLKPIGVAKKKAKLKPIGKAPLRMPKPTPLRKKKKK